MRHIVDLENKLVVIDWWETNNIPSEKEWQYIQLHKKENKTQAEALEMEELGMIEGDIKINTGIIKIIDTKPIDINMVNPVVEIPTDHWQKINEAIEKLSEPYTNKKITLKEAMQFLNKE